MTLQMVAPSRSDADELKMESQLRLELPAGPAGESFTTPRGAYGWLGEHQDEAAELAALLHEAAPSLALAGRLRGAPSGSAASRSTTPTMLPKARSYEISDSTKDRLRAAVPLPTGAGQVDWSRLTAAISSELLSFDEAADVMLARSHSAGGTPRTLAAGGAASAAGERGSGEITSPRSPGGERLEINSGGRVIFCLFAPAPAASSAAPTPRNSPDKMPVAFIQQFAGLGSGGVLGAADASSCSGGGGSGGSECSTLLGMEDEEEELSLALGLGGLPPAAQLAAAAQQQQQQQQEQPGDSDLLPGHLRSSSFSFQPLPQQPLQPPPPQQQHSALAPALAPAVQHPHPLHSAEGCLVLKFVSSRLLCQSEQFASELTRHVGLACPDSRILRQMGATEGEWRAAAEAAQALRDRCPDLAEEMGRNSCCLVMEFIPGQCLFKSLPALAQQQGVPGSLGANGVHAHGDANGGASSGGMHANGASGGGCGGRHLADTAEDLGRLFTLDMLLGNADRLPCRELGWRGNPENILYASTGRWAGRAVAIDAVVQRRPPGGLMSVEDSACERLAELALNDGEVAGALLRQALAPIGGDALAAIEPGVLREAAAAFQRGLKAALQAAASIKGLLEMMCDVTSDWIDDFVEDIELASGQGSSLPSGAGGGGAHMPTPRSRRVSSAGAAASPLLLAASASTSAQTMRIRQINHEAARNDSVGERVAHWKAYFREKGGELRAAVEEWQAKRGPGGAGGACGSQRLTTAFLDGTHPIVDCYELKVRLEHMLQRLRVLQQATLTGRPCRLLPRLYLSGAVEASSLHLLRHLGISHVLNATEDLLLPEEGQGFVTHRVPLRDVEEEDLSPHLEGASSFIDEALASGGSVLVHCHAGKSRSCSLVLAWLMTRRRWPLNRALQFLQRARPEAAPNAGYLAALLRLEEELFGRQTVKMKKTKPEPRACPECGDKVGLSAESVRVHLRLKHPAAALARAGDFLGSGSSFELPSPTSSWGVGHAASPRARSSGQPSPSAAAAPAPRAGAGPAQHAGAPQQHAAAAPQEQQQQQQPAAPAASSPQIASSPPKPIPGSLEAAAAERTFAADAAAGGAAAGAARPPLSGTRTARLSADAASPVPDSPPAMAAVLARVETGEFSLSQEDADAFLALGSSNPSTEGELLEVSV